MNGMIKMVRVKEVGNSMYIYLNILNFLLTYIHIKGFSRSIRKSNLNVAKRSFKNFIEKFYLLKVIK
jgi:hypothetical protein